MARRAADNLISRTLFEAPGETVSREIGRKISKGILRLGLTLSLTALEKADEFPAIVNDGQ